MLTRRRKPTAERREEIVAAVLRILGERGITALTTASMAKEVGLTTGALFRHFASLEEMLEETVRVAVARIDETFPNEDDPPLERLHRFAHNRVTVLASEPGIIWLLRSEQATLALPERAVAWLRTRVERSRRFILTALEDGVEAGVVRRDLPPAALLIVVSGTIHALLSAPSPSRDVTSPGRTDPDEVLTALMRLIMSEDAR